MTARDPRDFYPTDPRVLEALLRLPLLCPSPTYASALEPACGEGALVSVLRRRFATVHASDLYSYTGEECSYGVDFLTAPFATYDLVATNPPFSLAQEFISRAMLVGRSTAMLLRLSMLGSICRATWWRSLPSSPKLQVLVPRPWFSLNKHGKKGTDNSEYAWFLWGPMFGSLPPVGWLEWR